MMEVSLIQLLIDAMLFVLIWIVQLIVYPGFGYYNDTNLRKWHPSYSRRITVIVMPLMLGQLILYSYSSYASPSLVNLGLLSMVILTWVITFIAAVPLHRRIDMGRAVKDSSQRLVEINWTRTIIWTLIFITRIATYER